MFKVGDRVKLINNDSMGPFANLGMTAIVKGGHNMADMITIEWEDRTTPQSDGGYMTSRFALADDPNLLFKVGDRVRLIRKSYTLAAEIGTEATVTKDYYKGDDYLNVTWDRLNGLANDQMDGGYNLRDFELVKRKETVEMTKKTERFVVFEEGDINEFSTLKEAEQFAADDYINRMDEGYDVYIAKIVRVGTTNKIVSFEDV